MPLHDRVRDYARKFFPQSKEASDCVDKLAAVGVALGLGDPTETTLPVAAAVSVAAKTWGAVSGMIKLMASSEDGSDPVLRREVLVLLVANEAYTRALAEALADEDPEIKSALIPGGQKEETLDTAKTDAPGELLRGRSKVFDLYENRLRLIHGPNGEPVANRDKFARRVTEQAVLRMSNLLIRSEEPYQSLWKWLHNEAVGSIVTQIGIGTKSEHTTRGLDVLSPYASGSLTAEARPTINDMVEQPIRMQARMPGEAGAKVTAAGPGEVSLEFQASKLIFERAKAMLEKGRLVAAHELFLQVASDLEKQTAQDVVHLRARALGNIGHCLHRTGKRQEAARFFKEGHTLAPNLIRLRVNRAIADLTEGRYEEGEAALRALLKEKPDEPDVVELLSEALTRRDHHREAIETLLAHPRKSENYFCILSIAYAAVGERDKALEAALAGIVTNPKADYAEFCAGVILAEDVLEHDGEDARFKQAGVEKLRQAKKHIRRALELVRKEEQSPLLQVYLINLCALCAALREPEEALKHAEEAHGLGVLDHQGLVNVFAAQMGMRKVDDAVTTARSLRQHESLSEALSREMHAYLAEDRYDDIVATFDEAVRVESGLTEDAELVALRIHAQRMRPDLPGARAALIDAIARLGRKFPLVLEEAEQLEAIGDYAGAERAFHEAEALAIGRARHGVRLQCGLFNFRRRRFAQALRQLIAPDEDPLLSSVLIEYLISLTQLNRLGEVATIGLQAIKTRNFNSNLWRVTASALVNLGRLKEAEKLLRQLVQHDASAENHVMLGSVCYRQKNGLENAIKVLESGRSRHSDSFIIHVNLSGLYFMAQKFRSAFEMAKRARELDPERKEGHQAMVRMLLAGNRLVLTEDEKRLVQESIEKADGLKRIDMKQRPDGQLDLAEMMVVLKERHDHVQEVMRFYREKRLAVSILSDLIGRSLMETWLGLTHSTEDRIYCATGTTEEQMAEQALASNSKEVSIDATALITLQALGLLSRLPGMFGKIHVATSTYSKLQEELRELESLSPTSGTIAYHKGRVHLTESGDSSRQVPEGILRPVLAFIEGDAVTIEGMDEISWTAWQRIAKHRLAEWMVAPALLAKEKDCAYYGDDMALRAIATESDGAKGFSIQAFLRAALARGIITLAEHDTAVIRLIELNYDFISLSHEIVYAHLRRTSFAKDEVVAKIFRQLEASRYTDKKSSVILGGIAAVAWLDRGPGDTPSREEWIRSCIASLNAAQNRQAALISFLTGTIHPLIDFPEALSGLYLYLEQKSDFSLIEKALVRDVTDRVFTIVVERNISLTPRQRSAWVAMHHWKQWSRFLRRPLE